MEFYIAVMAIFAVWGIMDILGKICDKLLASKPLGRVTIYVECDAKALEGIIRSLMRKNPDAEIIVKATDGECRDICEKLAKEEKKVRMLL